MNGPDLPPLDPLAAFRALLAAGERAAAGESLERLLADPTQPLGATESATALALQARAEERSGDLSRARRSLERALALVDWADLRLALGRLLVRVGEKAAARRELDRALAINPRYRAATVERALLDASEGRIADSLATLRSLGVDAAVDFGTRPFESGLARLRAADVEEAGSVLRDALAPGDAALEATLAEAEERIQGGEIGGGLVLLRRAAAEHPGYADVAALLGAQELRAGFVDDGIASLVRALELNPDFHAARLQLARGLELRGERDRATAEVRSVLDREPAHPEAARLLEHLGGRRRLLTGG